MVAIGILNVFDSHDVSIEFRALVALNYGVMYFLHLRTTQERKTP